MIQANFFNAQHSQLIQSTLTIDADHVTLHSDLAQRNFTRDQVTVEETYQHAPLILQFKDGSHCEISDQQDKQKVLSLLHYQLSAVERWQANWKLALFAVILVMGFFYTAYRYGGPEIAKLVVPMVPQTADHYVGDQAQKFLDTAYLTPTKTSDRQYTQIVMVFRRIKPASPRIPLTLEIRESKKIGPNALALPNGTVFVTDEMYALLSKEGDQLSAAGEQELAGLLAHEIAHVELRHSMHNLVQTSLMTVLVGSMIGDFSSLAATAGTTILSAQYSQEKESEADAYAIRAMQSAGISPIHLAHLFEALENYSSTKNGKKRDKLPAWLGDPVEDFLSSHPPTKQRIRQFKQAAQASPP